MANVRRRKSENGYPRGEETKANIIRTAISLFGEKGFTGVSTREIASAAKVPPPSIQYYFNNKEGLYQACIEHMSVSAWETLGPVVLKAEALLTEKADANRLVEGYCQILETLADFLFGGPDAAGRALFVAQHRSPSNSTKHNVSGNTAMGSRIQNCCTAIVAEIAGSSLSKEACKIVSTTINGQLIIVHLARERVEEMLGWSEITPIQIEALKSVVKRQATLILNSYRSQ
ncbi:CerR family C-terminal domain-containing protein [Brucella pituitosa]|uniref:DUF1956 domain-containing protein n=1 Tax=Brucella pituitosa TaxID=571256 RepID=A0A643EZC8_9HYPH|nr:CerR family C-terminal domain-containing protein [Brucella pituitosa]KAB0571162.1 DUF1956 domain-containing protein [Brucella pituitosa]MCK4206624.1 CerR family C-terminal domain-containing protein [Brucella pituitosa]PJO49696.1 DUF1956 domain-containing protein [Brucella pituitosa]PRA83893.1 hypothetical protein CQ054_18425 [Ochrobactrum sp. MYb29]